MPYSFKGVILHYIFIFHLKIESLVLSVKSLNGHHFLDTVPYVELSYILSKFTGLDLCVVKKILDHRTHELWRWVLDRQTFIKILNNFVKKLLSVNIVHFDFLKSCIQVLFQNILCWNRVQRVPKFVGNTGINDTEKLVLSSLLVEHDTVGDVDNLDYILAFQWTVLHLNVPVLNLTGSLSIDRVFLFHWDYFKYHFFD